MMILVPSNLSFPAINYYCHIIIIFIIIYTAVSVADNNDVNYFGTDVAFIDC